MPDDDVLGAYGKGILGLVCAGREDGRLGAAMDGKLERHVPKAAKPDHCKALPCTQPPMLHRRKSSNPGTQQWRRRRQVGAFWNFDHEALAHNDAVRIAAQGLRLENTQTLTAI